MKALKNVLVTTSACSLITIGSAAMAQQDMYYTYKNCPSASLCVNDWQHGRKWTIKRNHSWWGYLDNQGDQFYNSSHWNSYCLYPGRGYSGIPKIVRPGRYLDWPNDVSSSLRIRKGQKCPISSKTIRDY